MEHSNAYYAFGRNQFGPFLYGFVRWLHDELTRKGYEKVFFFSRDGYLMQKAFSVIQQGTIQSEYVYFSRKSLRQALLWHCADPESSLQYLTWKRYISLGNLLSYYGFSQEERDAIAQSGGFSLQTEIPFSELRSSSLVRQIYEQNKERISAASREQERLLLAYLDQIGLCGKCAVVDIGWHGNMQFYLEQLARKNARDLSPEGFYIGISPVRQLTSPVNGYLYAADDLHRRKQVLCFLGCLEKFLQSTEGSADGYQQDASGQILPVLQQYEYDQNEQIVSAIRQWQQGALDAVRSLHRSGQNVTDRELTAPLLRFGMYPSMEDVKLFSFFYNTDGIQVWYTAQKPLYRYRPKELVHALAESPWKTGFLRSVFKIPLPYYWIYCAMKK